MDKKIETVEVGVLIYPDSLVSGVYGLTDMFRIANMYSDQHQAQRPSIRISHWQCQQDGTIACIYDTHPGMPNNPIIIMLPPSLVEPSPAQAPKEICDWLTNKHDKGAVLCSICGGSFLLAETGLLKNRRATTHWLFSERMAARWPDIHVDADKMIIDDGDIITAGGVMAWTDVGLRIVHRLLGPTIMMDTARFLLVDPPGREQRYYSNFVPRLQHGDEKILKVQHWLQVNGARNVSLVSMAKQAGMEERTFLRRFQKAAGMNPTEYCQQIRVVKAREMLEFTQQNVEQIAWSVGYEDPGAFRKIFQRIMGLTPADYRHRFNAHHV